MDVSIVVVNWNTKKLLRGCLQSIKDHAGEIDYEIIVVDNASSDGSAAMVLSEFGDVVLITNKTNRGYAAGANNGIRIATGRYVLILNSDILICNSAIAKIVKYADNHPEGAVFGCQIRELSGKVHMTCFRFPTLLNLFLRLSGLARVFSHHRFFGREMMLWWNRQNEQEVDVVSGMFLLVRQEAIQPVGLMDEDYFFYFEETDWCYRFSKKGWKMLFWPGACTIHLGAGSQSNPQVALKVYVQRQKNLLLFFAKHYSLSSYALAWLLLTINSFARGAGWAIIKSSKQLSGKNANYEINNMQKHWWAFKFCVLGREPS